MKSLVKRSLSLAWDVLGRKLQFACSRSAWRYQNAQNVELYRTVVYQVHFNIARMSIFIHIVVFFSDRQSALILLSAPKKLRNSIPNGWRLKNCGLRQITSLCIHRWFLKPKVRCSILALRSLMIAELPLTQAHWIAMFVYTRQC